MNGPTETTPYMRRVLGLAAFLVSLLGISMYVLADNTERTAAWTIKPPLTAAFLGGSYFASLALEYFASRERLWANVRTAVAGVVTFSFVMLGVTLVHLDRFHLGSELDLTPRFFGWIWLITYIAVPPVFAWVWYRQAATSEADPPLTVPMDALQRYLLLGFGTSLVVAGVAFLLAPAVTGAALWPWEVSALTGRAIGAWLVGLGFVVAHVGKEADWRRGKGASFGFFAFGLLQLAALARFPGTVSYGDWRTWLYLIFVLALGTVGVAGLIALQRARLVASPTGSSDTSPPAAAPTG